MIDLASLESLVANLHPPLSYVVFGGLGGLLYCLRQRMKGYAVKPVEYLARPVFGAASAYALTVSLGLPNHLTSLFVGYFGIDAWDVLAPFAQRKLGLKVPALGKHEPAPPKPSDEGEEPDLPL